MIAMEIIVNVALCVQRARNGRVSEDGVDEMVPIRYNLASWSRSTKPGITDDLMGSLDRVSFCERLRRRI